MGLVQARPRCRPVVAPNQNGPKPSRPLLAVWIWPSIGDYAAARIFKGIQETDLGREARLVVGHAVGSDWKSRFESEDRFLRSVARDRDHVGAIVWLLGHQRSIPALRALRAIGSPVVFVDRLPPRGFAADYVGTNNESAAATGVRHLLRLGHRRIALITNIDEASSVNERERGYRTALASAGIRVDESLILLDSDDEPQGVETAIDQLLASNEPPTAIFCVNDRLALQAYDTLQKRGIGIPAEMSVLGFDGMLRWLPGGGHLTTLVQDFERMGQLAAELVLERIQFGPPEAYRHVLLDAPLHLGGSTSAPSRYLSRQPPSLQENQR